MNALIASLGRARFISPLARWVDDTTRVPEHIVRRGASAPRPGYLFELAGPRKRLFFDGPHTRAAIVTCGGLCPGLNNVVRSLFLQLHHVYHVHDILGFRDGYRGLDPAHDRPPLTLTADLVDDIHREGGTILGTSRGPVDVHAAVDHLVHHRVTILFTVGGDGTQRGANEFYLEARKRGHTIAVVGVPKTIDNDILFVYRTFGYLTAVEQACKVIDCAHMEAHSVRNGISLVKLMGREAGFIAAGATVANQDVNFTLVPEMPFALDGPHGFLASLRKRIVNRAHAVIVVAEGAGQDLVNAAPQQRDESGNPRLKDIGLCLRSRIEAYFKAQRIPISFRYFDPSYLIRSVPADAEDAIICDLFARHAAHAAMAGKTGLVIGLHNGHFIHVPIELIVSGKKRLDPDGPEWQAVLAATGQPAQFV